MSRGARQRVHWARRERGGLRCEPSRHFNVGSRMQKCCRRTGSGGYARRPATCRGPGRPGALNRPTAAGHPVCRTPPVAARRGSPGGWTGSCGSRRRQRSGWWGPGIQACRRRCWEAQRDPRESAAREQHLQQAGSSRADGGGTGRQTLPTNSRMRPCSALQPAENETASSRDRQCTCRCSRAPGSWRCTAYTQAGHGHRRPCDGGMDRRPAAGRWAAGGECRTDACASVSGKRVSDLALSWPRENRSGASSHLGGPMVSLWLPVWVGSPMLSVVGFGSKGFWWWWFHGSGPGASPCGRESRPFSGYPFAGPHYCRRPVLECRQGTEHRAVPTWVPTNVQSGPPTASVWFPIRQWGESRSASASVSACVLQPLTELSLTYSWILSLAAHTSEMAGPRAHSSGPRGVHGPMRLTRAALEHDAIGNAHRARQWLSLAVVNLATGRVLLASRTEADRDDGGGDDDGCRRQWPVMRDCRSIYLTRPLLRPTRRLRKHAAQQSTHNNSYTSANRNNNHTRITTRVHLPHN